ncbi:hypothetical protein NLI96_g10925 [Meripilus lineatus]|uniref:F-box domain-containing protein n=1 Tax=Meripilus lineatus TaxID=2056292 RepID=A0AAD5YDS0_9APHY|nr:hypothetical protein NLI96_g10925 [Physisporinus lineatus]
MPPKRTRKSKPQQAEASSSKTSTRREASESVRLEPPTKRRRTLRGSLQNLPEMPLDILFEVCCHLNPLDVLNLARTNKAFRTLLMNRANVSFWTVARRNVEGLPECPSYLITRNKYARSVARKDDKVAIVSKFKTFSDQKERAIWAAEQKALITQIHEHSAKCEIWETTNKAMRGRKLVEIKQARYEAILGKLRALPGWEIEVEQLGGDSCSPLYRDPLIHQPRPLTEAGWLAVKGVLMPYMEKARRDKIQKIRMDVMRKRFHHLQEAVVSFRKGAPTKFFPNLRDFATCPEVRAIVDVDFDIDIDQESFEPLRPLVWDIVARWKEKQTASLVECIRSQHQFDEDCDITSLATCLGLACRRCSTRFLSYPSILWHSCSINRGWTFQGDYEDYMTCVTRSSAWDASRFKLEEPEIINSITTACGMDFRTVSLEEMDKQDPILIGWMKSEPGIKVVASWRAAVALALSMYCYRVQEWQWRLATSEEKISVASLQPASEAATREVIENAGYWDCAHCLVGFVKRCLDVCTFKKSQMIGHVRTRHNVENPKEEEDYFLEFAPSDLRFHRPVYIKSKQAKLGYGWLARRVCQAMENGEAIEVDSQPPSDQKVE